MGLEAVLQISMPNGFDDDADAACAQSNNTSYWVR